MAERDLRQLAPDASKSLLALLRPEQGPLLSPIRSELFGLLRFGEHGRSLGATHHVAEGRQQLSTFFPRLQRNIQTLRSAHRYIAQQASSGHDISPAAEWLLDNFHLIEAQLKAIHEGLPSNYFRSLPSLLDEPLAGLPRVYGVAWAFVAHTDGAFNEELLVAYLLAYQETRELKLSEMWALPTSLRVVLIENLRRLGERLATHKAARELANRCCDHLDRYSVDALEAIVAQLKPRRVDQVFLVQMAQRLHEGGTIPSAKHSEPHEQWLTEALPDLASLLAQQNADQTADNLSMSNAVNSLRAIGDADWAAIVARASALIQVMLTLPSFLAEHTITRDQTLHGIERLARHGQVNELLIASTLVSLLHECPVGQDDLLAKQTSHWLDGAGRPVLLKALGVKESATRALTLVWRRWATPTYLSTLLLGSLALVIWVWPQIVQMLQVPATLAWALACGLLLLLPASETMVALINRLVSESIPPQHLPRLALPLGIEAHDHVLVVIPGMLTSPGGVNELVHRLELHYLANPERHAQFALLTDWADAITPQLPSDQALLECAHTQLLALNERHAHSRGGQAPRFILLHRPRQFSISEQSWIGWERKRGKLEQLISALALGHSDAFVDLGPLSEIAVGPDGLTRSRFIVTLDADTQLPPGQLRELVAVALHPANAPRLDSAQRQVVAGHAILQPRMTTPLPQAHQLTLFHWLFAGQCGSDPYSSTTSEVYQDLFGQGTFMGKGLLHVPALHAVLTQRWPEGLVLSHDLLEGAIARCATVSDVTLIEEAPFHADVAASRVHRWTRGDWQLLPLMFGASCQSIAGINRWKMVDNLRRSLVAPASVILMITSLGGWGPSPLATLVLLLASLSAGPLMGALASFSPSQHAVSRRRFFGMALAELNRALLGGLWSGAQLLQRALSNGDAIARALYRVSISHRQLLQWTSSATVQAASVPTLTAAIKAHWREPLLAIGLLVALWAINGTPPSLLAMLLLGTWGASPVWTWWVSRPLSHVQTPELPSQERGYLQGIARDTWRFFEHSVTEQDLHLPPDNVQTLPHEMVAHRTSPTNIGLYLLSAACARQFGWISTTEFIARLEATLGTLDTLPRHRGHFFNWYDTQTGRALQPMYVSTVDSGNLCGHLLAVAQACLALSQGESPPTLTQSDGLRLQALAQRCDALAWSAEFDFLYHPKRHLFHLGYLLSTQKLDAGFYDLLASESRLTGLLAIARGDIPVNHWRQLGRPFFVSGAQVGLRSWSGSMFEYLMPSLMLDEPAGSVLHQSCKAAVQAQMAFGQTQGVPWGISESAHAGQDHTLAYQYAPHGVPTLALRRTPLGELVVAPYATALAAQFYPLEACHNFRALEELGARSPHGFIEALDFSSARLQGSEQCSLVQTCMAHHQGMTIVALANVLLDGVVRRWGMANAHIEAVASILHERAPREVSRLYEAPAPHPVRSRLSRMPGLLREIMPGQAAVAPTHLLSNGRYHVSLRSNGAGWSRLGHLGITRSRDDALRDIHGSFLYVRWPRGGPLASLTLNPAPDPQVRYLCSFHADRVCYEALWPTLEARTTVWVSPEDDIEFRQVELLNTGDQPLEIELISAFEVTLCDPRADETHPAFSNLFVRAQWQAEHEALWFERTPRLADEPALMATHFLACRDPQVIDIAHQTDRQRWLGRNHSASTPLASFDPPAPGLHQPPLTTGLDPMSALSIRVRIAPNAKATMTLATAASMDRATLQAIIDKYRQPSHVKRSSLMSATLNGIRMRTLRVSPDTVTATQTLTTALLLSLTRPKIRVARPAGNDMAVCDRRLLWRLGISGDRPIVLVSINLMQGLGLLRAMGQALQLWSWGGLACDLVVINGEPPSYLMPLQREITTLAELQLTLSTTPAGSHAGGPERSRCQLLRTDELNAQELGTLHHLARLHMVADGRPLLHHTQAWCALHERAQQARQLSAMAVVTQPCLSAAPSRPVGSFSSTGDEFSFVVGARQRPAKPWINVLANPGFGALLSETGGGYSWATNSRLNQLTAWSNDPVADPPSEWFLLQDCQTLEIWSVAPSAWGGTASVVHGQGYTVIKQQRGSVHSTTTWCVDAHDAVKQIQLRIVNRGDRVVQLRVIGMAEWMMGASRTDRRTVHTSPHIIRTSSHKRLALLSTQVDPSAGFGGGTAFLSLDAGAQEREDWTCDRRECFDALGRLVIPEYFGQNFGAGLDPCAAVSCRITLAPGEGAEPVFLMGYAPDADAARQLIERADAALPSDRMTQVREGWDALLGAATVSTPDPLFDALVNRWLLYQSVSCRLWAKAGFYQAGGATGFRDQLQDAMALVWAKPQLLRDQIVLCASRQFPEGDVQHWWHAPLGAGVRTHFSDDLLWLAHACVHYVQATGDTTLLDQVVPFIDGASIPPGAEDVYEVPRISELSASVYEHAARTLDRSLPVGTHGLPLMGSGDWNDGMNRVGWEMRGESVWLGWFLCHLVQGMAPLAHARGDTERAKRWEQAEQGWRQALTGPAWDGRWFKRAFFDNGQALGSHLNSEARIDLIAQAWSVLSNAAPLDQQRLAMAAVETHLIDHEQGLIRLLDPPLADAQPHAGYIQSYPPGVRENGAQYSHAGVWALMAQAQLAWGDPASAEHDTPYRYFCYLSPAHRTHDPVLGASYGIEPYVVAGDVYSQAPYAGQGGWSWYSGAAAWLHRAAIESILGLQLSADRMCVRPCLPSHWPLASLGMRRGDALLHFTLLRLTPQQAMEQLDGGHISDGPAIGTAQLLLPGQSMAWSAQGGHQHFVIPLL